MVTAITDLVFFLVLVLGLGAALAPNWPLKAGERLCLGIAAALLALYLAGFGLFVAGLATAWLWLLPAATLALIGWRRRQILALCREPEMRSLLGLWGVFLLWTIGLLALVGSYSGGGWAGDWVEHHQRTRVFMQEADPHMHFLGSYTLTSRPPLANVVTAVFMEFSPGRFADFQFFTTLLSTLFFFPGWLFYQRWKDSRGANALWALVLMLNPLVAQNTTFAWTKLTCTFWILSGSYFLLRGVLNELGARERIAGFLCLAAGLITHYSAGPWILAWVIAYAVWALRPIRGLRPLREAGIVALACGLLTLTWFGWAIHTYGLQDTGTSNSAAQSWNTQTPHDRVLVPLRNIVDTFVPHPFRTMDKGIIYQLSQGGRVRDYFFNIYQTNLPLAAGFSGFFVIIFSCLRPPRTQTSSPPRERRFWLWFAPFIILTGILVHTPPEGWGLAHICLQPLVIIGLAWIATRLPLLPATVRTGFVLLLLWDVGVGLVLPFLIEANTYYVDELSPAPGWGFDVTHLNRVAMLNYGNKTVHSMNFFADTLGASEVLIALVLTALLALIVIRISRQPKHIPPALHVGP